MVNANFGICGHKHLAIQTSHRASKSQEYKLLSWCFKKKLEHFSAKLALELSLFVSHLCLVCDSSAFMFSTGSEESSSSEMTATTMEPRLVLTLKGPASLTVNILFYFIFLLLF